MFAANSGHLHTLQFLLDASAEVDAHGGFDDWTALIWASQNGHADAVQVLLDAGAEVDARDNENWTALMLAAGGGHEDSVESLLGAGADIDARDSDGETALLRLKRPSGQLFFERLPFHKLHHDKGLTVMLGDFVDGADIGMVQGRCGTGFAFEPLHGLCVVRYVRGQELQRDLAIGEDRRRASRQTRRTTGWRLTIVASCGCGQRRCAVIRRTVLDGVTSALQRKMSGATRRSALLKTGLGSSQGNFVLTPRGIMISNPVLGLGRHRSRVVSGRTFAKSTSQTRRHHASVLSLTPADESETIPFALQAGHVVRDCQPVGQVDFRRG